MDEQTIKVLARFTEVNQRWPIGAWVCVEFVGWYKNSPHPLTRWVGEMSELEANQRGIFRKESDIIYEKR
jgi:hypothetical protein